MIVCRIQGNRFSSLPLPMCWALRLARRRQSLRIGAGKVLLVGAAVILLLLVAEVPRRLVQWVQATAQRSALNVERLVPNPPGHRGLIVVASIGKGISSAQQSILSTISAKVRLKSAGS